MANTITLLGADELKGTSGAFTLREFQIVLQITGAYATASKPTFNVLAALQQGHYAVKTVNLPPFAVTVFRDDADANGTTYTAPNLFIALSTVNAGSTSDQVTFRIDSGATNGNAGTEIPDGTVLNGYFVFTVTCSVT